MRAFLAVAEHQGFSRAAEALHMAQPVVSALVRGLEEELGFRLFDRTTRRVELTAAAAEFATEIRRLMGEMDSAFGRARAVGARQRGHLRVGAPPLLCATLLPRVLHAFLAAAPEVSVELMDRPINGVAALLEEGALDLAVGTFPPDAGEWQRIPLIRDHFALLCRQDHPLAGMAEVPWAALAGERLITLRPGNGIRQQTEQAYRAAGLEAAPAFELDQLGTVVAMVQQGLGITVLPPYALWAYAPALVARPLTGPALAREIEVVHRRGRALPPVGVEFVRQLRAAAVRLQEEGR